MPASMMTAWVALSPNVTGSRRLMPESGPMPGSTPTRVPTRQPRNAYHTLSGWSATAKPCRRLAKVLSTRAPELETEGTDGKLSLEALGKDAVRQKGDGNAVERGVQRLASFDDDEEPEQQQHHGKDESQPSVDADHHCGHRNNQGGVLHVAPVDL